MKSEGDKNTLLKNEGDMPPSILSGNDYVDQSDRKIL